MIGDLVGIKNAKKWDSIEKLQDVLHKAAKTGKLTVLGENWEKFNPQGVSGFLFLSESHIAIHLTPEHSFAWCDVFTCSKGDGAQKAMSYIVRRLKPNLEKSKITNLDRTIL